jgi:hypothetical protein
MLCATATDRYFTKRNGALFIIVTIRSEIINLVVYELNYYNFHTNLTIINHKKIYKYVAYLKRRDFFYGLCSKPHN